MTLKTLATVISTFVLTALSHPVWAVPQEGTPDPGEGLTALETTLYFVIAPLGLFLTIVILGYAIHRPRDDKKKSTNVLTEIR